MNFKEKLREIKQRLFNQLLRDVDLEVGSLMVMKSNTVYTDNIQKKDSKIQIGGPLDYVGSMVQTQYVQTSSAASLDSGTATTDMIIFVTMSTATGAGYLWGTIDVAGVHCSVDSSTQVERNGCPGFCRKGQSWNIKYTHTSGTVDCKVVKVSFGK